MTICSAPVTSNTAVPPPPGRRRPPSMRATRTGPAAKIDVGRLDRAGLVDAAALFCQRLTAAAVALVNLSSTVTTAGSAKPRATRFSSSWRTSAPSSTPADSRRHIGRSPNSSAGPGAPSTSHSDPPRSITVPSAGSAVITPLGAAADRAGGAVAEPAVDLLGLDEVAASPPWPSWWSAGTVVVEPSAAPRRRPAGQAGERSRRRCRAGRPAASAPPEERAPPHGVASVGAVVGWPVAGRCRCRPAASACRSGSRRPRWPP